MSAENLIASAIIKRYSEKLASSLDLDVALVGGGPSALVAARDLAAAGFKTAIFEKNLRLVAAFGVVGCCLMRRLCRTMRCRSCLHSI